MEKRDSIVIGDASALYLYLHCDGPESIGARKIERNPLVTCADNARKLSAFNSENPLYGGAPVDVLVADTGQRRRSRKIRCHACTYELPDGAFYQVKPSLYLASPELVFVRLARGRSTAQIVEIGMSLCAGYYLEPSTGSICSRSAPLVTPAQLGRFLTLTPSMRNSRQAARALRWVAANSASPMETKMWIMFCMPMRYGGFGLPFDALNYDVRSGRLRKMTQQHNFSIDMVNVEARFGVEFDGEEFHRDMSADKRRRNELATLGWRIFPIDKSVLFSADGTIRAARQVAHQLGVRMRGPRNWAGRYLELRRELGLER